MLTLPYFHIIQKEWEISPGRKEGKGKVAVTQRSQTVKFPITANANDSTDNKKLKLDRFRYFRCPLSPHISSCAGLTGD